MVIGRRPLLLVLAAAALLDSSLYAQAQDAVKAEKVRFNTVDGVILRGSFYASKKRKSPVVLLLHALGEDSRTKEWTSLAEELQKAGLNVLSFDFRGHGQSTEVDPDVFWRVAHNKAGVQETKDMKDLIEFKNFDKRYYPILANDIAAAKAYLDRTKNDDGICNTSNVILIGAETGATLGAVWMTSEWYRYKHYPIVNGGAKVDSRPQGMDVICGIWLTISPTLGGRNIRLDTLLEFPVKRHATPMVFMFSDGDPKGKAVSRTTCEKALKVPGSKKHRFITAVEIKGNKLTGSGLLQQSLGTEKAIVDYLEEVVDANGNEWVERDFRKSEIFWHFPTNGGNDQILPSKPAWEMYPLFDGFEKFLP